MNRRILILAVALGAQILLGAALNFGVGGTHRVVGPVLSLPRDKIDGIEISSKEQTATLALRNGTWHLPAYFDLPASADGVKVLFERFDKLDNGTPVATTADARKRFKVDASDFERKVVFKQGDKVLATVYLGTGGSRNRSMLRVDGRDDIREEPIASYELQTDPAQWADKTLLNEAVDKIAHIDVDGMRLTHAAAGAQSAPAGAAQWTVSGVPAGHHFDATAADKLAQLIGKLSYDSVLGSAAKPEYGLANPALKFSLVRQDGGTRDYVLAKADKEEWYALQVSDRKEIFKLLPYEATPLIEAAKPTAPTAQSAPAAKK